MRKYDEEIAWCRSEQRKAAATVDLIERGNLTVTRDLHDAKNQDWTAEYKMAQRDLADKMGKLADAYDALA